MISTSLPNFDFEIEHSENFSRCVIGVDEVGRGALAGPVVAGAVCVFDTRGGFWGSDYTRKWALHEIDDSKRLTPKRREELSKIIQEEAVWGVGQVGVEVIEEVGVVRATHLAMMQAVENLNRGLELTKAFLLVDGLEVPAFGEKGWRHRAIVKGDQKSISIAAASIIAKVFRDKLMDNLGSKQEFRNYGWGKNKGYGTKLHLEAIAQFGPTALHRRDFLRSTALVDEIHGNR